MSTERDVARGKAGEYITVIVLLLIVGFLGYLRFAVLPRQSAPPELEFDYTNPLLAAEVGDCVGGRG